MTTEKRVFDTRHEPIDFEFRWGGRSLFRDDDGRHTEERDSKGFEIEMVQICLGVQQCAHVLQGCDWPDISLHEIRLILF